MPVGRTVAASGQAAYLKVSSIRLASGIAPLSPKPPASCGDVSPHGSSRQRQQIGVRLSDDLRHRLEGRAANTRPTRSAVSRRAANLSACA
jgi:hypothetical protein